MDKDGLTLKKEQEGYGKEKRRLSDGDKKKSEDGQDPPIPICPLSNRVTR